MQDMQSRLHMHKTLNALGEKFNSNTLLYRENLELSAIATICKLDVDPRSDDDASPIS